MENFYVAYGKQGFDINDSQWDNIRTWPGYGNTMAEGANGSSLATELTVSYKSKADFAPFVDRDSNGVYEPDKGEFPKIKGTQMAWWMINDQSITFSGSSDRMQIEIAMQTYLYRHHTILDNQSFYEYKITNRGSKNLTDFIMGNLIDIDLGYAWDDFMGSDSTHSIGFAYNATSIDGIGQASDYGSQVPMSGMYFPGLSTSGNPAELQSVTYFINANSGLLKDPQTNQEYYNYIHGKLSDGSSFTRTCNSISPGNSTYFVYENQMDSTECKCNNVPGDRRVLMFAKPVSLSPGESAEAKQVALIRSSNMGCNESNPWQTIYDTITSNIVDVPISVSHTQIRNELDIFPTPSDQILHLRSSSDLNLTNAAVQAINLLGQEIKLDILRQSSDEIEIDVSHLRPDIYWLHIQTGKQEGAQVFVKE